MGAGIENSDRIERVPCSAVSLVVKVVLEDKRERGRSTPFGDCSCPSFIDLSLPAYLQTLKPF